MNSPTEATFHSLKNKHSYLPFITEMQTGDKSPRALYKTLFHGQPFSFLLESGKGPEKTSRYSFLGGNPICVLKSKKYQMEITQGGKTTNKTGNPIEELEKILNSQGGKVPYLPKHFCGGCVGFLGYDAVHFFEELPETTKDDLDLPDILFLFPGELVVIDHLSQMVTAVVISRSADGYQKGIERLESLMVRATAIGEPRSFEEKTVCQKSPGPIQANQSKEDFEENVRKVKKYLKEGDIYQANISRRMEAPFSGDPFRLYQRLVEINPSPFSSFLNLGSFYLVSCSPERLVKIDGNNVTTRPIAGTRPRGSSPKSDLDLSNELMVSEKERAEHLMLVDLERNDLGRICRTGSVKVDEFMVLESYSHVWHIISNIKGVLRKGVRLKEILSACFPGGTITGCPKVRCMEIIDELEPTKRGPYTGSIGYIGYDGTMDLNIIIRTIVLTGEKAYIQVGAGIVADSVPEMEYQETEKKGAAMLEALFQTF